MAFSDHQTFSNRKSRFRTVIHDFGIFTKIIIRLLIYFLKVLFSLFSYAYFLAKRYQYLKIPKKNRIHL